MGCEEAKESNYPLLLCYFEVNNEEQKDFCIKLRDSYEHDKGIKYEIRSTQTEPFAIKLKIKNFIYDINTSFVNNSKEEIQKTLNDIYNKLDGKYLFYNDYIIFQIQKTFSIIVIIINVKI